MQRQKKPAAAFKVNLPVLRHPINLMEMITLSAFGVNHKNPSRSQFSEPAN